MQKPTLIAALAIAAVVALPFGVSFFENKSATSLNLIETAAGSEASSTVAKTPAPAERILPAETTTADIIPSQPLGLNQDLETKDAEEIVPLRITTDKPEVVTLSRDAVNILVGSDKNLRVVPDTNRTLILIPKQPGSTYFKALDAEGKVIMQRHIIVGAPKSDYIRIRRACTGNRDCREYSVYYCPDMCHEVNVTQIKRGESPAVPDDAPMYRQREDRSGGDQSDGVERSSDGTSSDTLETTGEE